MASPRRSDRRGSSPCGKRAPDWEAPRLFLTSAPCELAVAPSLLRPYASSLRPEASMLSSSASAPSFVLSFANT